METAKAKQKRILIITGILIMLIVIGACGFFLVYDALGQKSYTESIRIAEKYVTAKDYENAIIVYENVIQKEPKKADTYMALAKVYLQQEKMPEAKITLKKGFAHTQSQKIQYMLTGIEDGSLLVQHRKTAEEVKYMADVKGELGWNVPFLQRLENYTFRDFKDEYGGFPEVIKAGSGQAEVVHPDLEAVCYYANTSEDDKIVDTKSGKPDETGMPEKITVDTLSTLFRNFGGTVSLDKLQKLSSEKIVPIKNENRTYIEIKTGEIILRVETDESGTVVSENAWNEIILLNANQDREKKESAVTGVVINAVNGEGVAAALLEFEAKDDRQHSDKTTAKADGTFSIELKADTYTIKIRADGYQAEAFELEVKEDKTYSGQQFIISPELGTGTARIVLEWNEQPRDLDSHLDGRTDGGQNVQVNYGDMESRDGDDIIAQLDVDTVNGYGPETTTIYNLNGVYEFKVVDFRRTSRMKEYGATVKVYLPDAAQPVVITMDSEAEIQNVWEVFELDHGKLNILNRGDVD